jgi:hypothetical protein
VQTGRRCVFVLFVVAVVAALATPRRALAEDKISLGGPFNTDGPKGEGYFHGDVEVSLDEFLRVGGHPEIADRIASRRVLRWTLMGSGLAVAAGGVAYGLSAGACSVEPGMPSAGFDECMDRQALRTRVGLVVGVVGAGVFSTGVLLSKKIPPIQELRAIVTAHNRRVRLSPTVAPGHAGVTLEATF